MTPPFFSVSRILLASRRALRMEILAASAWVLVWPTSCMRRSCDSGGSISRSCRPSEWGVRPILLSLTAFSIAFMSAGENGFTSSCGASGTGIEAMGVRGGERLDQQLRGLGHGDRRDGFQRRRGAVVLDADVLDDRRRGPPGADG